MAIIFIDCGKSKSKAYPRFHDSMVKVFKRYIINFCNRPSNQGRLYISQSLLTNFNMNNPKGMSSLPADP